MSGVNDSLPLYRLNKYDLEKYLQAKWPAHPDFKIEVCLLAIFEYKGQHF